MKPITIDTEIQELEKLIKVLNRGFETFVKNSNRLESMIDANHKAILDNGRILAENNSSLSVLKFKMQSFDKNLEKLDKRVDTRLGNLEGKMNKLLKHLGVDDDENAAKDTKRKD